MSWQAGDRVLAPRGADGYVYPATLRWLEGDQGVVDFDDGEQNWVPVQALLPCDFAVGDRVFARLPVGRKYVPARITRIDGSKIHIEYDDGEPEWTSPGMLRIRPDLWKSQGARPAGSTWIPGDRVLARWFDIYWYPATIQAIGPDGINIFYDDGDRNIVQPDQIMGIDIAVGSLVFARWQRGPYYYPAKVIDRDGDAILLEYDENGEQEQTSLGLVRVLRGPIDNPWKVGDHVLAHWPPEQFFYPAVVHAICDDIFLEVHYDDGDRAKLTPDRILPLDLQEGGRVYARRQGGRIYFPARIMRLRGEHVSLQYDDGVSEDTALRVIRVLPQDLP